ncbi:MAG: chemotaxis response regulator protein-glutamate methylesterase [Methylomicrobium sp.]
MKKIRLLIIDDSALIRALLTEIFNRSPDIEVVGTAADPYIAREKIKQLNPDVLTLDVEMPRMNGLSFLRNLMRLRPMPVVMISTLTEQGADITLEALKLGAVDFVAKPKLDVANALSDYADEMIAKVKMAAQARPQESTAQKTSTSSARVFKPQTIGHRANLSNKCLIAIGASTGGTEAIKRVVETLPDTTPPIIISQHLPQAFSASFARHVNEIGAMHAMLALDDQPLIAGNIYIAPGDKHLTILENNRGFYCRLDDSPPVNRHKPSVEVMFDSVAQTAGDRAIGIMLTGMGADGAAGMKKMHEAGAFNIVQDEVSSVVWGMPGEAYKIGAADIVLPLDSIADQIMTLTQ